MFKNYRQQLDKRMLENTGIALIFMLFTFLFLLKSPLNVWQTAESGTDSSVFKYVAFLMEKGYMPYRDTFDHKGPFIYIINLLGNYISYYRGIWVVELVSLFITFIFGYKTARLASGKMASVIATFFAVSLLFDYFEGGNLVEEYAMPFLTVSLYIYIDYGMNLRITKIRLILCGFCFGAVCMLRPNMISVWIVFSMVIFLLCIKNKNFVQLQQFTGYFILGFGMIVIPIMVWLIKNHSLTDFIEDYIIFNMAYSSEEGGMATLATRWNSFFFFLNSTQLLFALVICFYLWIVNHDYFYAVYIIYLFFTLILICMSGHTFGHYGMVLIPAVIFPMASFLGVAEREKKHTGRSFPFFILLYLLSTLILPDWMTHLQGAGNLYDKRKEIQYSVSVTDVCRLISANTNEGEKISVYGNWNIIYVLSQRISASKYSYQFPIGNVNPSILDQYFKELEDTNPKMVIVAYEMDERMQNFLNENNYIEILPDRALDSNVCVYILEK